MRPTDPPAAGPNRVLLTNEEAARDVFGVSLRTFHSLREQPWMPQPVVLGPRTVRWPRAALEAAVAHMPRADAGATPHQLLRGKVEKFKSSGAAK